VYSSGRKSPANVEADGAKKYPFLINREQLDAALAFHGSADDPHFCDLRVTSNIFCIDATPIFAIPDQVWVSDIDLYRHVGGLAVHGVILDLFSRKVVGWKLGETLEAELCGHSAPRRLREAPASG
jgi:hypothetical protein